MGEFFDGMDHLNAGELDYMQLQRVAKRRAATLGGGTGRMASTSVEPGELDIALQGPERTRQLKDMLFMKEVDAIETYEKMKEVKSFVATGPPLTQPFIIEATHRARDVFYAEKRREERAVARARQATELSDPAKVRVEISEPVAKLAADTTPKFDSYEAEVWGKREGVMFDLQLAVRVATLRARLSRRVAAVHAALAKAGIGLHDKHAVHQLVLSRSKAGGGGGGKSAGLGSTSTLSDGTVGGGGLSALAKAAKAVGLSMEGLAPFIFPEAPSKGAGVPQGDPLPILPIEPFDETKLFALRVPRRYVQMDYREALLSAPGAFPPMVDDRPLRIGAPFESGRLLPTGTAVPVPDTWGLPSLLLMPPPRPPPPPEPADPTMDDLSATKALGGDEAKEAAGDEEEDAELSWDEKHRMHLAQLKPPILVQVHPRVMCRPPRANGLPHCMLIASLIACRCIRGSCAALLALWRRMRVRCSARCRSPATSFGRRSRSASARALCCSRPPPSQACGGVRRTPGRMQSPSYPSEWRTSTRPTPQRSCRRTRAIRRSTRRCSSRPRWIKSARFSTCRRCRRPVPFCPTKPPARPRPPWTRSRRRRRRRRLSRSTMATCRSHPSATSSSMLSRSERAPRRTSSCRPARRDACRGSGCASSSPRSTSTSSSLATN